MIITIAITILLIITTQSYSELRLFGHDATTDNYTSNNHNNNKLIIVVVMRIVIIIIINITLSCVFSDAIPVSDTDVLASWLVSVCVLLLVVVVVIVVVVVVVVVIVVVT